MNNFVCRFNSEHKTTEKLYMWPTAILAKLVIANSDLESHDYKGEK